MWDKASERWIKKLWSRKGWREGNRSSYRYSQTANVTLNLLCGLTGVTYANTVNGPSNTFEFLRFVEDAFRSVDPNTGRPCLEPGNVIVMDNCPFHHNEGGEI